LANQEEVNKRRSEELSPNYTYNNEVLYFKGQLWILQNIDLTKEILELKYNSKVARHMG
jgi:hypothetical protein